MVAVLTAALMSAAEISNLCSVVGVVVCFVCMVIFILRIQGEELLGGGSVVHVNHTAAQVAMLKVHVPFSVHLVHPSIATYKEVRVRVRGDVVWVRRVYWGVGVDALHAALHGPWHAFHTRLQDHLVQAAVTEEPVRGGVGEVEHRLGLASDPGDLGLGSPPRRTYPLVLCLARDQHPPEDPTAVGAVVVVVHIRDEECRVPTCVLHQYLKQYSGQLTRLQALYTQTKPSESKSESRSESEASTEDEVPLEEACVVCQSKRTTRALLPCRHVCVCRTCFTRLATCPMCRARILSYFLVAEEDQDEEDQEEEEVVVPTWWQRVSNVINEMMEM